MTEVGKRVQEFEEKIKIGNERKKNDWNISRATTMTKREREGTGVQVLEEPGVSPGGSRGKIQNLAEMYGGKGTTLWGTGRLGRGILGKDKLTCRGAPMAKNDGGEEVGRGKSGILVGSTLTPSCRRVKRLERKAAR